MTPFLVYSVAAALLVALGFHALLTNRHLVRQIIALNVLGGGVFLFLVAIAFGTPAEAPDPVPHALVLTGIVVAVSISAFALAVARHIHALTGRTTLTEEDLE